MLTKIRFKSVYFYCNMLKNNDICKKTDWEMQQKWGKLIDSPMCSLYNHSHHESVDKILKRKEDDYAETTLDS